MMMEKLLIEEQIIKRWHQKTITRPSPIEIHPVIAVLALLLPEEVRFVRTGFDTIRLESKGIMMINENENE